jgi:SAM-dependent methyltransferase
MSHAHARAQDHDHDHAVEFTQDFWDDFYRSAERIWSGQPNPQLVAQTADLTPGEALDAGSGEGGDAIWLASQGWTVTAVDVSAVALERGAANAAAHGSTIADRITWRHEDLYASGPGQQRFDLVSAQFIHFRNPGLESMHRRLAAAVRPGGTLLVVTHHPDDLHANVGRTGRAEMLPLAGELTAALDPGSWDILVAGAIGRPATDLDGQPVTVTDTVLRAVRRP